MFFFFGFEQLKTNKYSNCFKIPPVFNSYSQKTFSFWKLTTKKKDRIERFEPFLLTDGTSQNGNCVLESFRFFFLVRIFLGSLTKKTTFLPPTYQSQTKKKKVHFFNG